jgi:hypothetical protein
MRSILEPRVRTTNGSGSYHCGAVGFSRSHSVFPHRASTRVLAQPSGPLCYHTSFTKSTVDTLTDAIDWAWPDSFTSLSDERFRWHLARAFVGQCCYHDDNSRGLAEMYCPDWALGKHVQRISWANVQVVG